MYFDRKALWEYIFSGQWAEIIIPTITPAGEQFIGCLIPINTSSSQKEFRRIREHFAGDPQTETTIVTKVFGKEKKRCLSVVHFYRECHLSQAELAHAEESLSKQIYLACGMYTIATRFVRRKHALIRLT